MTDTKTSPEKRNCDALTFRERQVVTLLSEGATNKEIALDLKLAVKTVEAHSLNARRKIGSLSIAVLTRFAIINGLSPLLP